MIFKCKNCGANAIFSPEKSAMYCPYCESTDCEEIAHGEGIKFCINCGGELSPGDYLSACKCDHCGSYIVFEERTEGTYEPHLILPFKIGKKNAQDIIKKEFGKKAFIPSDFLSEGKMSQMEGMYVPFFMYDYQCNYDYTAKGTKIRVWRTGNTEYTEHSTYQLRRNMDIEFDKIPVDASIGMEDGAMDLMEPYDYKALEQFQAKYMSGFFAETYNMPSEQLEPRAKEKATKDAESLMQSTLTGYSAVTPEERNLVFQSETSNYALLPVWNYFYQYKGKKYPFQLNGQTGKMVGAPPVSYQKAALYGSTLFISISLIGILLNLIMGVL